MLSVLVDSCDDIPHVVALAEGIVEKWGLEALMVVYERGWGWKSLKDATPLPATWTQALADPT